MVTKNYGFFFLVNILFLSSLASASQGDDLWKMIEWGSLSVLQDWTNNPFNNVHAVDDEGLTLLHMAARKGQLSSLNHLLGYISSSVRTHYGETPLHEAAYAGHRQLILPLVLSEADVDAQDCDGNTSLHIAITNNQQYIVQSLLECSPDFEVQNNVGRTPVELASVKVIADALFARGALPLTQQDLDEVWRDDITKDMLDISSRRYYDRLYLIQNLLDNQHNVSAVLQDLIAIDMLVPEYRRKEIRTLAASHRKKRARIVVNEAAE